MKKCTWGTVGLACAALTATAVAASQLRVRDLIPEGKGVAENPCADGMAKLKFYNDPVNGPSIRAHVHLHHFQPGTTYSVAVDTDQGGADRADVITTNDGGNGNVVFDFPVSAQPVAALVVVYRDEVDDNAYTADDPLTPLVNEDEVRAIGTEGF